MAEDVIFEDSPIAKYLASTTKKGRPISNLAAYKIEKLPNTRTTDKKKVVEHSQTSISSPFPSGFSILSFFNSNNNITIGNLQKELLLNATRQLQNRQNSQQFCSHLRPYHAFVQLAANKSVQILSLILSILMVFVIDYIEMPNFVSKVLKLMLLVIALQASWKIFHSVRYQVYLHMITSMSMSINDSSMGYFNIVKSSLRRIQEVELVSQGYRITSHLTPIARLERNAKSKNAKELRSLIQKSCSEIQTFVAARSQSSMDNDDYPIFKLSNDGRNLDDMDQKAESSCKTDLSNLKFQFHNVQCCIASYLSSAIIRKLLILKINDSLYENNFIDMELLTPDGLDLPEFSDLQAVHFDLKELQAEVDKHLSQINSLIQRPEYWIKVNYPGAATKASNQEKPTLKTSSVSHSCLQHLNSLQANFQTSIARISLIKDQISQIDRLYNYSTSNSTQEDKGHAQNQQEIVEQKSKTANELINSILHMYSEISSDIDELTKFNSASSGSIQRLVNELQSSHSQTSAASKLALSSSSDPSVVESADILNNLQSNTSNDTSLQHPGLEKVYEIEKTGGDDEVPRSTLTREERIAQAQEARKQEKQKESETMAKFMMVRELKNVLQAIADPSKPTEAEVASPYSP